MKVITAIHLTAHDKKLINFSLVNNLQDVYTSKKRLKIISKSDDGIVKANLWSYEVGIGIGAKMEWRKKEIQFYQ